MRVENDKLDSYNEWLNAGSERRPKRFKLDLIVWHPTCDNPPRPLALIEVKKGQSFDRDVRRTSQLLTFCHPDTLGYQIPVPDFVREAELNSRRAIIDEEAKKSWERFAKPPIHGR